MINKRFQENWLKILKYNSNVELGDQFKFVDEKVRIPLTPIEINPYLLYYLFEIIYPKFINSQQNVLDIIITDDGKNVIKSYLYKTRKAGIHESIEMFPHDIIKVHKKDYTDIVKFYNRILEVLIKKKGERVSSIRVFKENAINHINQYCVGIEDLPFDALLVKFLDLVQKLVDQDLFVMYPEPKVFTFVKDVFNFLNGYQLSNLFKMIYPLLPEFNISLVFGSEELVFILHLQKIFVSKSETPYLRLKLMLPNELDINIEKLNENEILDLVRDRLQTDNAYYINQSDIISFLVDFINLPVNIKKENFLLIIQKLLFGFRSFEKHWFLRPKPIIYNNLLRFLLRIFGLNINLRKTSHWAIPDLISNIFDSSFGLNSNILVILTDTGKSKKLKLNNFNYLEEIIDYTFLFEIENKTLVKIQSIPKEILFTTSDIKSLESIRYELSEQFGFLSSIIIIDKLLLQNFVKLFIFNHSKYALLPKIKTLKMLKKQKYFYIFPELPIYKLIQKKGAISLIKLVLPILIDKHEF
ncbi:MAG: hypothetical protein ACFFFT_02110 [Candidatus Thorarchaeota archaeon]